MYWVHGWWTTVESQGPPWTGGGTDRKSPGHGSALTGVGSLATSERRSSLAGVEHGVPVAGLTRARVVVGQRRRRNSVVVVLKLRERG
jgi:hypothetical protein